MSLQAYIQRPCQTRTLPCVKLRTVVSRLPTPPMVCLDTDPLQTPVDANGICGGSVRLSPAAAGINRDGRRRRGRAVPRN